ncbi:hypothetical protein VE00_05959 [Pseudogymnoascus sp. WSF 3629]|nr:hypothetical protein VE00_05959 [Pseudogymnoascus sp. WSF 3629]
MTYINILPNTTQARQGQPRQGRARLEQARLELAQLELDRQEFVRQKLYRLEHARLEHAWLEHAWMEHGRREQALQELAWQKQPWQEDRFIMLPTLPNNEPDEHRTLHHYHHRPNKYIHGSPHPNYPDREYQNPRYIIPDTNSPWTGAEDSLLLEQIPHTAPPGIRAPYGFQMMAFWPRIAQQMTRESRQKNISNREYTPDSCESRFHVIFKQIANPHIGNKGPDGDGGASQIEKPDSGNEGTDGDGAVSQIEKPDNGNSGPDGDGGVSQIENPEHRNRGPDSHRGVNPYGYLIPAGYQLDMPPYIGLDSQLTPIDYRYQRMEANLLGMLVNVQRIRTVVGVGQWVTPGQSISHSVPLHDEPRIGFGQENHAMGGRPVLGFGIHQSL